MAACLHGEERKPVLMGGTRARRAATSGAACRQGSCSGNGVMATSGDRGTDKEKQQWQERGSGGDQGKLLTSVI